MHSKSPADYNKASANYTEVQVNLYSNNLGETSAQLHACWITVRCNGVFECNTLPKFDAESVVCSEFICAVPHPSTNSKTGQVQQT